MKIYWSIDKIPELAGLSPEQKKQAFQFYLKKYTFKLWQTYLCIFVLVFLLMVIKSIFHFSGTIADAVNGGIAGIVGWLTIINALRPHLRTYASKHFANSER